jgi:hypothetical protein
MEPVGELGLPGPSRSGREKAGHKMQNNGCRLAPESESAGRRGELHVKARQKKIGYHACHSTPFLNHSLRAIVHHSPKRLPVFVCLA